MQNKKLAPEKNCTDNQQNPVPCLGSAVLHRGWLYNFTTAESGKYGSIKQNQRKTDHEDQKTDHAEAVEHRFNGPDLIAGRQGLWSAERCIKKINGIADTSSRKSNERMDHVRPINHAIRGLSIKIARIIFAAFCDTGKAVLIKIQEFFSTICFHEGCRIGQHISSVIIGSKVKVIMGTGNNAYTA